MTLPARTYAITYSTGTSRNDERRYVVKGIPEARLAARIAAMQSKGKSIFSVEVTA